MWVGVARRQSRHAGVTVTNTACRQMAIHASRAMNTRMRNAAGSPDPAGSALGRHFGHDNGSSPRAALHGRGDIPVARCLRAMNRRQECRRSDNRHCYDRNVGRAQAKPVAPKGLGIAPYFPSPTRRRSMCWSRSERPPAHDAPFTRSIISSHHASSSTCSLMNQCINTWAG